jgi:hypothetical protein
MTTQVNTTEEGRPICCWTHCDSPQGRGTWSEINGEALPVCEEHWFGNWHHERAKLRLAVQKVRRRVSACIEHDKFLPPEDVLVILDEVLGVGESET